MDGRTQTWADIHPDADSTNADDSRSARIRRLRRITHKSENEDCSCLSEDTTTATTATTPTTNAASHHDHQSTHHHHGWRQHHPDDGHGLGL